MITDETIAETVAGVPDGWCDGPSGKPIVIEGAHCANGCVAKYTFFEQHTHAAPWYFNEEGEPTPQLRRYYMPAVVDTKCFRTTSGIVCNYCSQTIFVVSATLDDFMARGGEFAGEPE